MRKKALVPIANGSEEIELVGIVDTLRRAGIEVTVASVDGIKIKASRGMIISADILLKECNKLIFDLIVLPGGLPGAEHLRDSVLLTEMLKQQADSGRYYAAICASPVIVLQTHGLLKDKKATAHPAIADNLANQTAAKQKVVVDGNCITSQGPGTVLEFSLKLIELLINKKTSRKIAEAMLIDH